jgi:hypothetical protein
MASGSIDWSELARELKMVHSGSTHNAKRALEVVLGDDNLRAAVDTYVAFGDGAELARSILWHLHPWSAMQRCHEIYQSGGEIRDRRRAIDLLRVVADRRALPWIREYLDDPDPEIRAWGLGILDQLLFAKLVEQGQCTDLLDYAREHSDPAIRDKAVEIHEQSTGKRSRMDSTKRM